LIPEEAGYVDQQILIKRLDLGGIGLQPLHVSVQRLNLVENHAARDAPPDGSGLVVSEVHA
jgi:hypothetical protein